MNRKLVLLPVLLVVAALAWFGWRAFAPPPAEVWLGYVEGESLYISAPVSGTLGARYVDRGAAVKAGQPLFLIDPIATDAETDRLAAQADAARAQRADLEQDRQRLPELQVARASQAAARAQLVKTQNDYARFAALFARGFVSRTQLDAARAARDVAEATLAQAVAQERSGLLSNGRVDQVRAATATIVGADAVLRAQRQRRREISPVALSGAMVEQSYYNPGEWVPANAPVLSLLPDDKRRLRFFVPETRIASLRIGSRVGYACDGCCGGQGATISYIAPRAEFTPPVIYSEHARAKLVFMVEATLPASARPLPPGLPVTVTPPAAR